MSIVDTYLAGLHKALPAEQLNELKHAHGASAADLQRLTERYPLCPASLLQLLGQIDGTHYRDYPDGRVMVLILGSDVFEYPYYLSSVDQILEEIETYTRSIEQIIEDVIFNADQQLTYASLENYFQAFEFFYQNDAFMEFQPDPR
ncbi:hypothetical protein NLO98_24645 [Pseudomonas syringae]|nr:hypothetical protein [Pseudomonas syringae]